MASLKQVADWHLHPEKKIEVDPASFGRNYLSLSAPEDLEERECVLFDASELKKLAIDYLHPEKPVTPSSVNCARNYFDRPSAKVNHADYIHTQGYANHHVHMEEDYVMHHDDYHHYDYHHQDDVSHGSFTSHGDHFDMDKISRDSVNLSPRSVIPSPPYMISTSLLSKKKGTERKAIFPVPLLPLCFLKSLHSKNSPIHTFNQ
jgi:hypothetical protein